MSQTWKVTDKNTAKFFIAYIEDQVEQHSPDPLNHPNH